MDRENINERDDIKYEDFDFLWRLQKNIKYARSFSWVMCRNDFYRISKTKIENTINDWRDDLHDSLFDHQVVYCPTSLILIIFTYNFHKSLERDIVSHSNIFRYMTDLWRACPIIDESSLHTNQESHTKDILVEIIIRRKVS